MPHLRTRMIVPLLALCASSLSAHPQAATQGKTAASEPADSLKSGFQNPPDAARPRVWWHWMNGNITWDGVQKDMDWMKRIGIAGLQSFDAGVNTPQVVETRLPYMTDGWKDVFRKTALNAEKLNLELGIAASPGWSETGGPWVTPEDAMKKMAWSVTRVRGGQSQRIHLAKPPATIGVFQTSHGGGNIGGGFKPEMHLPEYYRDQKIIAVRVPEDTVLPPPTITASGGTLQAAALSDGDLEETAIELPAAKEVGGISWITFDYGHPITVRGLTMSTSIVGEWYDGLTPATRNGMPPEEFHLESSEDGQSWHDTGVKIEGGRPERTISLDSIHARWFRFVSVRPAPVVTLRPLKRFSRPRQAPPEQISIKELVLRGEATVHSFEEKGAWFNNTGYYKLPSGTADIGAAAKIANEIDLTGKMNSDGDLDWTAPAGEWLILRIGYSLTGGTNGPASAEATGLEVDKMDPAAIDRYMDHYLAMYRDATDGHIGKLGLHAMMFDSWEAGNTNWTPQILADFQRLRGYDPVPWLPALAGYVVESPERSDAFLWDWRRTIQQLIKINHYDHLTATLHDLGMIRYGEAHEELFALMADGMEMKQSADIPMGAMWQVDRPGEIEPVYFNDLQESASVAHIYGQNIAASESLTGGPPFGSAPWNLKPTADAIFLAGVNRIVIHTSAHQPVSKGPGLTLGVGQYFTRNETWAEQAKPWIDYLSRISFMLQQGHAVSDIAVFYGEAAPVVANYREEYPAVPEGYRYDYINADVILNKLSASDHDAITSSGMCYRAIFLGHGSERISLPVLLKLQALVRGGITLIGQRPTGSPSLADDPVKVRAVLDELWPGNPILQVGQGKVFASSDTKEALTSMNLPPDVTYEKPRPDGKVMFIHRQLPHGEIYFLSNRTDRTETIESSFRVTGLKPELWDPATGLTHNATYHAEAGRTVVSIPFDRFGSTIVVFREQAMEPSHIEAMPASRVITQLQGPWTVHFQPDRGAPASTTFPQLSDFRENADPAIRYFSGTASYIKDVTFSRQEIASGKLRIDLGQVDDIAEVWVNGKPAGTAWKPPYSVDITPEVKEGHNHIEIRSTNLWVNRLIGDVQPGVTKKYTFTAADGKQLPVSIRGKEQHTFPMPYTADAPLRASGLIGPVVITSEGEMR